MYKNLHWLWMVSNTRQKATTLSTGHKMVFKYDPDTIHVLCPHFISWLFISELHEFFQQQWIISEASGFIFIKAKLPKLGYQFLYIISGRNPSVKTKVTSSPPSPHYFWLSPGKSITQALLRTMFVDKTVLPTFRE